MIQISTREEIINIPFLAKKDHHIVFNWGGRSIDIWDDLRIQKDMRECLRTKDYSFLKILNNILINTQYAKKTDGRLSYLPRFVQIEHTNRCNASCIMCNHFYLGNRGCSDINPVLFEKIEEILPYCDAVMIHGDGEPFLYPHIVPCMEKYRSYGVKLTVNTNLSYLTSEIIYYLGNAFGSINISCDGCSADTYELIRRGLSFERFRANLSRLQKETPQLYKNLDCVLMRENIKEVQGLVRFAKEYGFRSIHFNMLGVNPYIGNKADSVLNFKSMASFELRQAAELADRIGIEIQYPKWILAETKQDDLDSEQINFAVPTKKYFDEKQKRLTEQYANLSLSSDYLDIKVSEKDLNSNLHPCSSPCKWAMERCFIDLKGRVTTCCYNVHRYFGSLAEADSFDEIWNGPEYVNYRNLMLAGKIPEWCASCEWFKQNS